MTGLILTSAQSELIRAEAGKHYPRECCGLLIGEGQDPVVIAEVVPAENQADSDNRFLIDPQVQFDWIHKVRGTAQRIVGHFHSHPNGRAEPSKHDRALALEVGQIWLIMPVTDGQPGDLMGFEARPKPGSLIPIPIEIR